MFRNDNNFEFVTYDSYLFLFLFSYFIKPYVFKCHSVVEWCHLPYIVHTIIFQKTTSTSYWVDDVLIITIIINQVFS